MGFGPKNAGPAREPGTSISGKGFLRRLARDRAGNTIAIMAASIIPLAGIVGGAVDMSRLYLTKTRLQQACDAGALAGRKVMGGGQWSASNGAANTAALQFFDGNFKSGAYGTTNRTRSFSESAGKVTGTASAQVPMTVMKIFRQNVRTVSVTCDAEMRLPNTDVMFVLDTTGSMASNISGDTTSKMDGLKKAVKCFYEILQKIDTNADCGSTPSGGISNQVQVRFGFMPYATNVNVGRLLPTSYFADNWTYQSREKVMTTETYYTFDTEGTVTEGSSNAQNIDYDRWDDVNTYNNVSNSWCRDNQPEDTEPEATGTESDPYNNNTTQSGSTQTVTWQTSQPYQYYQYTRDYSNRRDRCTYSRRLVTYNLVRNYQRVDEGTPETHLVFSQWHYGPVSLDVSGLKNGTSWNNSVTLPIGNNGTDKVVSWDGCIEERHTTYHTSYWPIPSDTQDLDIDLVPNQSNANSLWGPALGDAVYLRRMTSWWDTSTMNYAENDSATNYQTAAGLNWDACPPEAVKLQQWPTASTFQDYVDGLSPGGNTYHDIGLLWGARFISPTGIFASENAYTPLGGEIERHLIFMTDGEACTGTTNYQAYGLPFFDRRTTDPSLTPTSGCSTDSGGGGTMTAQVIARYQAICSAIKNKNITLWVIYFGSPSADDVTRMTACATDGRFYQAANNASLISTFSTIAAQISQLRLTS